MEYISQVFLRGFGHLKDSFSPDDRRPARHPDESEGLPATSRNEQRPRIRNIGRISHVDLAATNFGGEKKVIDCGATESLF